MHCIPVFPYNSSAIQKFKVKKQKPLAMRAARSFSLLLSSTYLPITS
jgi:hypothetical protein